MRFVFSATEDGRRVARYYRHGVSVLTIVAHVVRVTSSLSTLLAASLLSFLLGHPGLHQAVGEVQLEHVDLDSNEEKHVPQHGVGKTLPSRHIISESFGDKLVAVGGVAECTNEDRENGTGEGAEGKLFDVFVAGLVAGGQAEKGDRDRQQPQPLPQQGL